jgi:hypothetical protein
MTTATTSAVWRSTGGDQTRTAVAGSMVMITPFYIANAAVSANVTTSSAANAATVILPANCIVTDVFITNPGTGGVDIGFTPIVGASGPGQSPTLGTKVQTGFASQANVAVRQDISVGSAAGGSSLGNVANATNLIVVSSTANALANITNAGPVSGSISYFVYNTGYEAD